MNQTLIKALRLVPAIRNLIDTLSDLNVNLVAENQQLRDKISLLENELAEAEKDVDTYIADRNYYRNQWNHAQLDLAEMKATLVGQEQKMVVKNRELARIQENLLILTNSETGLPTGYVIVDKDK